VGGCLLDLDQGSLTFYRNGAKCGPGFTAGVVGPLVRAVQMNGKGVVVKALPTTEPPADGKVDWPAFTVEDLKRFCRENGQKVSGVKKDLVSRLEDASALPGFEKPQPKDTQLHCGYM
jgi:hypothetical protein